MIKVGDKHSCYHPVIPCKDIDDVVQFVEVKTESGTELSMCFVYLQYIFVLKL